MTRQPPLRKVVPGLVQLLRRLRPYVRPHRRVLVTSFGALLVATAMRLAEPWPLKLLFDHVFALHGRPGPPSSLGLTIAALAAAIVAMTGLRAGAEFVNTIGFARLGNRVVTSMRSDLYRHLQRLSLLFHGRSRGGDLVLRLMSDVNVLRDVAATALLPLVASTLTLAGMVAVMLWMSWPLALLALSTLPLLALSTARLSRSIRQAAVKQRKREGSLAADAAESIAGIKVVQSLSLEEHFADGFAARNSKASAEDVKVARLSARLERSVDLVIGVSTALVVVCGGFLVLERALTPGDLLVFLTYLRRAFRPMQDFAKYTGRLSKALASGERVLDVLEVRPEVEERPNAVVAPRFRGDIRFERVTFGYAPGAPVLRDLDLEVRAGERVAIVGPSGIGKTTLANLLLRLFDPWSGRVLVDGVDIRELTLRSLRSQISVVMQDSVLFATTVRENIGLGAASDDLDAIVDAAVLANADEFIRRLPEGYDTVVGERGATLSGGERQRIAIARAALRRAPLLLLDEPTTGLDEENERTVMQALGRLASGCTTLVISHDLLLASQADRVLYLEQGRVVESGTHPELLRAGGRYATLFLLQATDDRRPETADALPS